MKYLAELVISEPDLIAIRHACGDDPAFPQTFAAWEEIAAVAHAEALAAGMQVPPLPVAAETFIQWCQDMEIIPGLDALRAYGLVQRRRAAAKEAADAATKKEPGTLRHEPG